MKKVYCIIRCFTHKKLESRHSYMMAYVWRSLYEGGFIHGVRQVSRKRRAPICMGRGGGEVIGREIQYAIQSHFNAYNFQIQWIILQLSISQLKNKQALSNFLALGP